MSIASRKKAIGLVDKIDKLQKYLEHYGKEA